MHDNLKNLLFFLADPNTLTQEHQKSAIQMGLNYLLDSTSHGVTKQNIAAVLQQGLSTKDPFKAILLNSALLQIEEKAVYSANLRKLLCEYKPSLTEANHILMSLNIDMFNKDKDTPAELKQHYHREVFKSLFEHSVDEIKKIYDRIIGDQSVTFKRTNRAVILTRQMLFPPHAPSVRTLEFAKNLKENYNKDVLIVSSSEFTIQGFSPIVPYFRGNSHESFIGKDNISYEGVDLPFSLFGNGNFTEESVEQCLRTIIDFQPELILSIGAPNMIGEVFNETSFGFFYMSGHGIPLTRTQHFHTWDEPSQEERQSMIEENIEKQHLFVSTPGYHKPPKFKSLNRTDYDLTDDAFVFAVIGLRLDTEVTEAFKRTIKTIIAGNDKAHFIFAGAFETYEKAIQQDPLLDKHCRYLGLQPDIMAVYEMCDVYLNPTRLGGGSSAAQALQAGVPVVTLPSGDVGFMALNFPDIADYDEMASIAVRLSLDADFLTEYQDITKSESDRLSVRNQYLQKIMDEFEKFANERALDNVQAQQTADSATIKPN